VREDVFVVFDVGESGLDVFVEVALSEEEVSYLLGV
jgi:hypothetical protein